MTTSDVLNDARRELLHLDGLDERSQRLRREWRDRADLTREQLATLATELGDDLGERASAAREVLLERYHELEEELPIEEFTQRAQRGAWQAAQVGLSGLFTLPALLVRALRALSSAADDVAVRGADLSERGREMVSAVPPSRKERRRRRARTTGVGLAGLVIGVVIGWVLANRDTAAWESRIDDVRSRVWDLSPADGNGAAPTAAATTPQEHDEAEASEPEARQSEADEPEGGESENGEGSSGTAQESGADVV